MYVLTFDISKVCCEIIKKYITLLQQKDNLLSNVLNQLQKITNYNEKKNTIIGLLTEDSEARIFEIISYAILKNHYKNIKVYFGFSKDKIYEEELKLYKTGRTNANDGGIDFVMRPVGRFFQVTEVDNYDKYLLDIDKVVHFPVTFVIKTFNSIDSVKQDLRDYILKRSCGMKVIENRYKNAIEEIITINELILWINELTDNHIADLIKEIDVCYRLEMNLD